MELKDLDVNEVAEPVESSTTETETVETPVEETPEVVEETTEKTPVEQEETQTEVPESEPEQPKRSRAEERIRNLARENRELQEKVKQFTQQTAPELQSDEVSYDDLNKVINERALQAAELLIASKQVESQAQNQAKIWAEDFAKVKESNPQLDPKSPNYDKDLDATLARLLDDGSGMPRTDILVSEVINTFKKRETATESKAKEEGKAEATARLAKQMAESAVTPTTNAPSSVETYSDEDLEKMRTENPKEYLRIIDKI